MRSEPLDGRAEERIPGQNSSPGAAVLATADRDYLEDEHGAPRRRVLAALDVSVRRAAEGGAILRIELSAIGPRVDPELGFEGVRGGNRITARELTKLLADQELRIATRRDGRSRWGQVVAGRRGAVPVRRVEANGQLDLLAESAERYVLSAVATSSIELAGRHETYLLVGDAPRLLVVWSVAAGARSARVLSVESLGGPDIPR